VTASRRKLSLAVNILQKNPTAVASVGSANSNRLLVAILTIGISACGRLAYSQQAADDRPWYQWENRAFTSQLGLLFIYDGAVFSQDADSKSQVGDQVNDTEWRAERLLVSGQLNFSRPWSYILGANYNGLDAENPDRWSILDLRIDIPFGSSGRVRIGKQKVFASQEWMMPGVDMVNLERSTVDVAFVPQRNIGVMVAQNFSGERGVWSAGWFNDWFTRGNGYSENGNQYTARVSYLPVDTGGGLGLLQVAGAIYYKEATNGMLRYRSRPEINEADYFIDTGEFAGDHSLTSQVEMTAIRGSLMVYGNASITPVSAPQSGDPLLHGWFLGASYILTGEHHGFQRRDGYYAPFDPGRPIGSEGRGFGAWEVGTRYSLTDLSDGAVDGGRISRWTGSVSWYPSKLWRVEFNYGYITETRSGLVGHSHGLSARLQWTPF
jgi:phosphate-selective porin OprO and OprP